VHGQRLAAEDLRDLLALADHQRRRHVRALHATWGIALGLVVDRLRRQGVMAAPGVAYDNCGRLLVLCAPTPVPDPVDLAEPLALVLAAGPDPREPSSELRLVGPEEVRLGLDVPLALLRPGEADPDLSVRRYARRAAPPIVAAGRSRRGTVVADGNPHDWEAWIDTERAGFDVIPAYVAEVGPSELSAGTASVEIRGAALTGFTVRVRVPAAPGGQLDRTELTTNPSDLSWIAVLPQTSAAVIDAPPPRGPCENPYFEERFT
jgi:hypothetical protein